MRFIHQGETIPPTFNGILVKLILKPDVVYYYIDDKLIVYNRKDIRITFNKKENEPKIRSFDSLNAKPLNTIVDELNILKYLEDNVDVDEYCEFEKFLFERNG